MTYSKSDLLYQWILGKGGVVTTTEILQWGMHNYCQSIERRARELYKKGRLDRRDITPTEMNERGLRTPVKIYFIPSKSNAERGMLWKAI